VSYKPCRYNRVPLYLLVTYLTKRSTDFIASNYRKITEWSTKDVKESTGGLSQNTINEAVRRDRGKSRHLQSIQLLFGRNTKPKLLDWQEEMLTTQARLALRSTSVFFMMIISPHSLLNRYIYIYIYIYIYATTNYSEPGQLNTHNFRIQPEWLRNVRLIPGNGQKFHLPRNA
jgi:hypothetical protein